ncbi:hypothetical protein XFPR_12385 [Xylella fastidiosa]|uniref:Uncharacterized protein n=2 Tax=Xylella fastidiosa TaxID=2371 RepID=Q9PG75_XYLFA|nr:hypothetical protein [Xylella fastidiosa]ETE35621.1 hypothetical protein B398_01865 [Xylella fastidiosa 32]AAF83237.1 hypothetical protein XF_0427 [Xylella fastidiosa 9a5c]KXB21017.1 hypothetical protein ADT30_05255 [Xylella fastidiosa]MDG5823520.1 hypothetical protein [Xylella fastidiosa subsp. pauca]MDG5826796.1 hypothetical protein [Xylella fastidiosa subsp. pauca]
MMVRCIGDVEGAQYGCCGQGSALDQMVRHVAVWLYCLVLLIAVLIDRDRDSCASDDGCVC